MYSYIVTQEFVCQGFAYSIGDTVKDEHVATIDADAELQKRVTRVSNSA